MKELTFGSLFAGVGGFDLGFERAGLRCLWQVEKDEKCRGVLEKHWPDVKRYKDVKDVGSRNLTAVDVICGGFPCQPHSYVGERQASSDERELWKEFARIIGELKPRWVVAENVAGLLSSENGRFFGRILRDLAEMGYDAEWQCIKASAFGAPHSRERIFIIAYPNGIGLQTDSDEDKLCLPPFYQECTRYIGDVGSSSVWNTPRPIGCRPMGMGDGVSHRMDKAGIKMMGNAIVPQIAEYIGRIIIHAESNHQAKDVGLAAV